VKSDRRFSCRGVDTWNGINDLSSGIGAYRQKPIERKLNVIEPLHAATTLNFALAAMAICGNSRIPARSLKDAYGLVCGAEPNG
jgi:hypothetical protein